jgi:hypothetical protein
MIVIVLLICRGWGAKLLASVVVVFHKGEVGMQMVTCRFSWGGFVMDVVQS